MPKSNRSVIVLFFQSATHETNFDEIMMLITPSGLHRRKQKKNCSKDVVLTVLNKVNAWMKWMETKLFSNVQQLKTCNYPYDVLMGIFRNCKNEGRTGKVWSQTPSPKFPDTFNKFLRMIVAETGLPDDFNKPSNLMLKQSRVIELKALADVIIKKLKKKSVLCPKMWPWYVTIFHQRQNKYLIIVSIPSVQISHSQS